jgi:hypothetical protein
VDYKSCVYFQFYFQFYSSCQVGCYFYLFLQMSSASHIDLPKISSEQLFDLLDGISEEQAENSEYGGDSDPEDTIHTFIHNSYI